MTRLYLAGAAILATVALAAATYAAAQTSTQPVPGIDIVVQKKPCGPCLVVTSVASVGADGAFGGQARLPAGIYTVSTACSPRVRCPAHRLTTLMVNGKSVIPDARGGVSVAVGDLNGDGLADLTTFSGTIKLSR